VGSTILGACIFIRTAEESGYKLTEIEPGMSN